MSEDIYERSAQDAIRVAQQAGRATQGGLAEEAGLTAVQDSRPNDAPMNEGRSFSGGGYGGPGDVQARESEANRAVVQTRRLIEATGGLDMNDFLDLEIADGGRGAHEAMSLKRRMGIIAEHTVDRGARQVVNDAYMNPNEASMMEQESYQPQYQDGWQVQKTRATLKSGKAIAVFVVEDALSGMTTGKKYRLAEVAERVARVINATGDPSDPRIGMIDKAYDNHVSLMRERAEASKAGNRKKVAMIESKLQEVNTRLGIA